MRKRCNTLFIVTKFLHNEYRLSILLTKRIYKAILMSNCLKKESLLL